MTAATEFTLVVLESVTGTNIHQVKTNSLTEKGEDIACRGCSYATPFHPTGLPCKSSAINAVT